MVSEHEKAPEIAQQIVDLLSPGLPKEPASGRTTSSSRLQAIGIITAGFLRSISIHEFESLKERLDAATGTN